MVDNFDNLSFHVSGLWDQSVVGTDKYFIITRRGIGFDAMSRSQNPLTVDKTASAGKASSIDHANLPAPVKLGSLRNVDM